MSAVHRNGMAPSLDMAAPGCVCVGELIISGPARASRQRLLVIGFCRIKNAAASPPCRFLTRSHASRISLTPLSCAISFLIPLSLLSLWTRRRIRPPPPAERPGGAKGRVRADVTRACMVGAGANVLPAAVEPPARVAGQQARPRGLLERHQLARGEELRGTRAAPTWRYGRVGKEARRSLAYRSSTGWVWVWVGGRWDGCKFRA